MDDREYLDVEQNSPEWIEARCGLVTASEFGAISGGITARAKSARTTYMHKIAGEILTGRPVESPNVRNLQRGHENEPAARALYELTTGNTVDPVGLVRWGRIGASPDGLVGTAGCVEFKDALPHVQIARLLDGNVPPEYWFQVLGHLLVTGREWCDFMSHCRDLPPLLVRVDRDYAARELAALRVDLDQFVSDLDDLVDTIRRL